MKSITVEDLLQMKAYMDANTPPKPQTFAELLACELYLLLPGCEMIAGITHGRLYLQVTHKGKKVMHTFEARELLAMQCTIMDRYVENEALKLAQSLQQLLQPDVINVPKDFEGLILLTCDELNEGLRQTPYDVYTFRIIKPPAEIIEGIRYFDINYHYVQFAKVDGVWHLVTQINYV